MKCPMCQCEMEPGFLQGMQRVAWVKKPRKLSLLPKDGEVLLDNNVFRSSILTAWICRECRKIVVDYAN